MTSPQIAVLGGGTMGSGIAQVALAAGYTVALYDISADARDRAQQRIAEGLRKQGHAAALAQLRCVASIADIAGAQIVIEAAPEQVDIKQPLLRQAAEACPAPAVIASNTSSLPIAALASACPNPERVAGLHFFNPVHRMALVELVRTAQTDDATVAHLEAFCAQIGKTVVLARDTPGFIVNRVARPFYAESLRLLGEGAASIEAIDTLLEQAGGFPLGPFSLMDLIGIDINFAVTQSVYEQMFHEPRFRPHPIQHQLVLQGAYGRKSGRGFYSYAAERPPRPKAGAVVQRSGFFLLEKGTWGEGLPDLLRSAGLHPGAPSDDPALAVVPAGRHEGACELVAALDGQLAPHVPVLAQSADVMVGELAAHMRHPERLVGFDGLFTASALTLVTTPLLHPDIRANIEGLVRDLGRVPVWVADTAALVVPRVVAMLANEAAFTLGEGVASAHAIDTAMRLGTNHPAGPLARAHTLGYRRTVTLLDHLHRELGEDRYRVAPALRRAARFGQLNDAAKMSA